MFKPSKIKKQLKKQSVFDALTIAMMAFGFIALLTLVFFYVRPLRLAEIKVPVATDKATYPPSAEVSGIFFGETYYDGDVKILREVFCKNYKATIKPPAENALGEFFQTQAKPTKLEGNTVRIGKLPNDVPIGSNCVIQFTNVYDIQTPFGIRHETIQYYTQNFSIIGQTESNVNDDQDDAQNETQQDQLQTDANFDGGFSVGGDGGTNSNTNQNTQSEQNTPPSSEQPAPAEPVTPPTCRIDFLGIKLFCE